MLDRLAKLASISASVRRMVEKQAGVIGTAVKAVGKIALNHPGKTALGVGAGIAGVGAVKENKRGFVAAGAQPPTPGIQ